MNDGQDHASFILFQNGGGGLDGGWTELKGIFDFDIDFAAAECAAHRTPGQCIKGIGALVEMAHGMSRSWGIPKRGGGGAEAMLPHLTKHAPQAGMDKGE